MGNIEKYASLGLDVVTKNYVGAALKTVGVLENFVLRQEATRVARWWKGLIENEDWEEPQEVQGIIEAKIRESSKAKETVYAAAREILDAVSDEAVEVIGSLTAEYIRGELGPDAFFRGAVRLLADVSSEELKMLRKMINFSGEMAADKTELLANDDGTVDAQDWQQHDVRHSPKLGDLPTLRRLTRLLLANDLAESVRTGNIGGGTGPGMMVIYRDMVQRLARHLGLTEV